MEFIVFFIVWGVWMILAEKDLTRSSVSELMGSYRKSPENQVALELLSRYGDAEPNSRGEIIWTLLAPHQQDLSKIIASLKEDPQEEIQRLYVRLHHLFIKGKFPDKNWKSWLARILRNDLLNQKKRTNRLVSLPFEYLPETEDVVSDETLNPQLLKSAISKLTETQRKVIELRYLQTEGKLLTYKQIAEMMGCSTGQVHGYLDRAKENLRNHLNEYV